MLRTQGQDAGATRTQVPGTWPLHSNITRSMTLISGAPTGAYVRYAWDHCNQLTKVEFYNAPGNDTAALPNVAIIAPRDEP